LDSIVDPSRFLSRGRFETEQSELRECHCQCPNLVYSTSVHWLLRTIVPFSLVHWKKAGKYFES